jgi:phage tail sheath protein FI
MAANPRDVQVSDAPTALRVIVPVDSAHIVVVDTAPVHSAPGYLWTTPGSGASPYAAVVNQPVLCEVPKDFTTQLGLSSRFGPGITGAYGASEVYDCGMTENQVSPITVINPFDPWSMSTPVALSGLTISGVNTIAVPGEVILASLVVTGESGAVYVPEVDYHFVYNDNSLSAGTINVFSSSLLANETSVTVNFYTPNLANITKDLIIGGVDTSGNASGLAVLEKVFTVTDLVPAIVLTPNWGSDPEVYAAANSQVQNINNGRFRSIYIGDVDADAVRQYSAINQWKNENNFVSRFTLSGWPAVKLGDKHYHASTMEAVLMAVTDRQFGGIPYVSPSNKSASITGTILWDGSPITVDPTEADYIENLGIFTFLNFRGWVSLGDYQNAWPNDTDPVHFWIPIQRMFIWLGNTLSVNLHQFIDLPGNLRTLSSINETIQAYLNTIVQAGAAWTARCTFNPDENPIEEILSGRYHFTILWSPPTPIRTLLISLVYDTVGLAASITSIQLLSTS